MTQKLEFDKAILVYQLDDDASVLRVCEFSSSPESDRPGFGRGAHTLMQACANKCEMFAQGLAAAVVEIRVAVCQRSGDVAEAPWKCGVDEAPDRDLAEAQADRQARAPTMRRGRR